MVVLDDRVGGDSPSWPRATTTEHSAASSTRRSTIASRPLSSAIGPIEVGRRRRAATGPGRRSRAWPSWPGGERRGSPARPPPGGGAGRTRRTVARPAAANSRFSRARCWATSSDRRAGPHRDAFGGGGGGRRSQGRDRHVLELHGEAGHAAGEDRHHRRVVVGGHDVVVGHLARREWREPGRRSRPPRGSRAGGRPGRTCGPAARCRRRPASLRAGSPPGRIAGRRRRPLSASRLVRCVGRAARWPGPPRPAPGGSGPGPGGARVGRRPGWRRPAAAALVAPAGPMAIVATGTPAGICTIDSRESMPLAQPSGPAPRSPGPACGTPACRADGRPRRPRP